MRLDGQALMTSVSTDLHFHSRDSYSSEFRRDAAGESNIGVPATYARLCSGGVNVDGDVDVEVTLWESNSGSAGEEFWGIVCGAITAGF